MAATAFIKNPQNNALPPTPVKPKVKKGKGKEKEKERAAAAHGEQRVAEVEEVQAVDEEKPWEWNSLTEESASKYPPVFTKDGSYFFAISGATVKIYSAATGQVVSVLPQNPRSTSGDPSHNALTCAVLNPSNPFQLITGSLNGHICIWDIMEATLLQVMDMGQPIYHICAHENIKDSVFVSVGRPNKKTKDDNAVILCVSLTPSSTTTDSPVQKSSKIIPIGKTRATAGLAFSSTGKWLVAVAGHKAYVARSDNLAAGFTKYVSPERLTCLSFHPTEDYFATGDDKGHIRLWYCLRDDSAPVTAGLEKKAQTTILHWHAHAVASIAFTSNGAYLLSGGEESTLVIWQLHSGKKEFVPRLGAPISTISLSRSSAAEEEYLLGLVDSTFTFVNAGTLKVSRSYSRIKLDPSVTHALPSSSAPMAIHTATSTLILPSSHQSSLQIYSPSTSKLVSELEVSSSNRISRRDDKALTNSVVEKVAISSSGDWMATFDYREGDESFRAEAYMKIWHWDRKSGYWILNTRIDRPHGTMRIKSLSFCPISNNRLLLVTVGEDGNVKTWSLRIKKLKSGESEEYWVNRSSFGFRSQIPRDVSWSPDGSLLAVSLGTYVALYDPITNSLRQNITLAECRDLRSAHFTGNGGRYLVCRGPHDLIVWDVIAQRVRWHHRSQWGNATVIPHPRSDYFAVLQSPVAHDGHLQGVTKVLVFRPTSSTPCKIRTLPFGLRNVIWFPLSSSTPSEFILAGITNAWSVVALGDKKYWPASSEVTAQGVPTKTVTSTRSIFQDIFGKSAFADVSEAEAINSPDPLASVSTQSKTDITNIFNAPAYLLPPLGSMFDTLVETLLTKNPPPDPKVSTSGADIEDVDMEEEDEEPVFVGSHQQRTVDQDEIDSLVAFFRVHTLTGAEKPSAPKVNGSHKTKVPNGVANRASIPATPQINGSKSVAASKRNVPVPTPVAIDVDSAAQLNTTPKGSGNPKKRKMSVG